MEFKNPFYQSLLETHSKFSDNAANNTHVCVETRGKRACTQLVSEWYLIILHLAYTTAIALSMVYFLNGTSFGYEGSDHHYALATWRCVFILLEKNGPSLAETSSIVSLHLPTIKMFYTPTAHSGHAWTRAMAIVILCLDWPAQFSNPIASGSVSWIPSRAYRSQNASISLNVREKLVKESAGRSVVASTFLGTWTHEFLVPLAQRILTHLNSYPNGTIVKNATVPMFDIRELEWVTDKMSLPIELEKAVTVSLSGYLNFSRERGPLEQVTLGTAALLKDTPWIPPAENTLPPAQTFSRTKFAAIYVSRNDNHGLNDKYDCRNGKSSFYPLPSGIKLYNIPWNNNQSDCIAVAKLSITAGTTQCFQGDPNIHSESTCILSSGAIFIENTEAASDVLVEEVFSAMPEVQAFRSCPWFI
ncbi:unnamed protein product [Fusarium graminearum]|nr:unnamed protein product [Fusarium graminearum]